MDRGAAAGAGNWWTDADIITLNAPEPTQQTTWKRSQTQGRSEDTSNYDMTFKPIYSRT